MKVYTRINVKGFGIQSLVFSKDPYFIPKYTKLKCHTYTHISIKTSAAD